MAAKNVSTILLIAGLVIGLGGEGVLYGAGAAKPDQQAPVNSDNQGKEKTPEYVYKPEGKRDPFESLLEIRRPVAAPTEPQTPLQKFDLAQLRMVGAIVGMKNPRAMIVAPDGKSYILKIGTKVGKNNGVVVKIRKDKVQIEESFYDFTGEVRTSTQTIELPKREGV